MHPEFRQHVINELIQICSLYFVPRARVVQTAFATVVWQSCSRFWGKNLGHLSILVGRPPANDRYPALSLGASWVCHGHVDAHVVFWMRTFNSHAYCSNFFVCAIGFPRITVRFLSLFPTQSIYCADQTSFFLSSMLTFNPTKKKKKSKKLRSSHEEKAIIFGAQMKFAVSWIFDTQLDPKQKAISSDERLF